MKSSLHIGGEYSDNEDTLLESHFCVGTPGRLYELFYERKVAVGFENFEILIMDEADRLIESM